VRLLDRAPFAAVLARPVFRRARVVTTVSQHLALAIRRRTGIAIPPDAIQPMPVAPADRPWSDGAGDVVVVGRLSGQKRINLALEAMAIARLGGLTRRLTIAGDGPMRPALERQALALGLSDAVRFLGQVPPAGIPALFATASCCLMPAQHEGFGLAAAEALMQGVPVVVCVDGGGLCDIVPAAGAGRTVAPEAEAIAAAMLDLLRDPDARDTARAEGAQWRTRLSPDFVADRCLTWYQRALHA
jgi:alpha-1,6-mannosyltransferase